MPHRNAPAEPPPTPCTLCAARHTCLLGQRSLEHQRAMAPLLREISFRKGDELLVEGVVSDVIKTIKLGTVMATRRGPDGVARPVALLGRNHVLGQYGIVGQPTQLGAYGQTQGRICELRLDDLRQHGLVDEAFMEALHGSMVRTFGRLADWLQVMRMDGLPRRLLATLLLMAGEQGSRTVRLPGHAALSQVLSTSRESIVRALGILENQGALRRLDRKHVELDEQAREHLGQPAQPD